MNTFWTRIDYIILAICSIIYSETDCFFLFYLIIFKESVSRRANPLLKVDFGSFNIHRLTSFSFKIHLTNYLKKSRLLISALLRLGGVGSCNSLNNYFIFAFEW